MAYMQEGEKQAILVEIVKKIEGFFRDQEEISGWFLRQQVKLGLASQLLCCYISISRGVIKPSVGNVFSTLKITSKTYFLHRISF